MTIKDFKAYLMDNHTKQDDGCWIWNSSYAWQNTQILVKSNKSNCIQIGLHRLAFSILIKPIPANTKVLHTCGKYACINPNHLYLYKSEAVTPYGKFDTEKMAAQAAGISHSAVVARLTSKNYTDYYRQNKYK